MALPSGRSHSGPTVDPDRGIYVEMLGVMEIRYTSDYDTDYPPEDMFGKSSWHICLGTVKLTFSLFRFPSPGF